MNKVFKLVWNRSLHCWVVVSELTKSRGKKSVSIAACALVGPLLLPNVGHAFTSWNSTNQIDEWMNKTSPVNGTFAPQLQDDAFVFDQAFGAEGTPLTNSSNEIVPEPATFPVQTNVTSQFTAMTIYNKTETSNATASNTTASNTTASDITPVYVDKEEKQLYGPETKEDAAKKDRALEADAKAVNGTFSNASEALNGSGSSNTIAPGADKIMPPSAVNHTEEKVEAKTEEIKAVPVVGNSTMPDVPVVPGDSGVSDTPVPHVDENGLPYYGPLTKEQAEAIEKVAVADDDTSPEPIEQVEEHSDEQPPKQSGEESDDASNEQQALEEETPDVPADEPVVAPAPLPAEASAPVPEKGIVVVAPQAGSYNSNAWAANTMFQMNLNDRLGSYFQGEGHPHQGSAWIRYSGSHSALKDTSGQLRTKGDKNTVMMGVDMLVDSTNDRDQVTLGVMGGYGHYDGNTSSSLAGFGSKGKVDGYGLGLYGTYQQNAETQQGVYVDSWLLWNQFDNHVKGNDLPSEKYKSKGMTASLEFGYNAKIAERNNVKYVLQPHAQLTYQHVRSDNFTDSTGTRIEFQNGSRMRTSLGLRAAAHIPTGLTSVITPHFEANWLHSSKGYGVRMNNTDAKMNSGRDAGQLKLGVEGNINQRISLNVELFHNQGTAGYHETGGNLMAKYRY
ncbi:hypothetical protein BOTU111921_15400 [Bordetella tumbae]|uniref:autotransporter outer membrane beta-barrel domain-containing protein n=1 Tax=Bordetella tumbae TaxID=1649139 RepID=UPI0039EF58C7